MQRPKMVLFDYGGTILHEPGINFLNGEREVFKHVVRNPRNLTSDELSKFETEYYNSLQGIRDAGYEAHELQMLRFKYEYNEIELDISYEEVEEILWGHTSPLTDKAKMPHVTEMLDFLKAEKIRSAVISNIGWSGKALRNRIDRLLPDHEFEFVLASSEYGLRKPDRRLFELALKKAGLSADEVWFCGDTFETDIIGAYETGMYPIYYQGTTEDGPRRKQEYVDVPFAYTTIYDWKELEELLI